MTLNEILNNKLDTCHCGHTPGVHVVFETFAPTPDGEKVRTQIFCVACPGSASDAPPCHDSFTNDGVVE